MGHRSVHVHVIMYTTQGHCVGGELAIYMYECGEFALSVWNVMAEAQQALYCTGESQCFDE